MKERITNNIYTSWLDTLTTLSNEYTKNLDELTIIELQHLKWLLEQQIEILIKQENDNE